MKTFFSLILIFTFSCSHNSQLKVNNLTEKIYDVEQARGKIFYFCSEPEGEEPRSYLSIYLMTDKKVDLFFSRRKLGTKECLDWVKEIDQIYEESKWVRLVGVEGSNSSFEDKDLPAHLNQKDPVTVNSTWFFSRIVTNQGCMGHFGHECNPGFTEKKIYQEP